MIPEMNISENISLSCRENLSPGFIESARDITTLKKQAESITFLRSSKITSLSFVFIVMPYLCIPSLL